MITGWEQANSGWYYLDKNGDMKTGWVESNGIWYYTNLDRNKPESAMIKNS